jgi:hypothetical protein
LEQYFLSISGCSLAFVAHMGEAKTLPIWLFVAPLQLEDLAVKFCGCVHNLLNFLGRTFCATVITTQYGFPYGRSV